MDHFTNRNNGQTTATFTNNIEAASSITTTSSSSSAAATAAPISSNTTTPQPTDGKYHKLATEYSKVRAQANVLKRALIEEQSKTACLRETLRLRESSLRRVEQEVDSLGFRNKQLQQRVAALQDDLHKQESSLSSSAAKKISKIATNQKMGSQINKQQQNDMSSYVVDNFLNGKSSSASSSSTDVVALDDSIFVMELHKKNLENAQLVSVAAEKTIEIQLYNERIVELEKRLVQKENEQINLEKKLRKDIEQLTTKTTALENKLATDSGSLIGSDDTLSVTESVDNIQSHHHPHHQNHHHHHHHQQQHQHQTESTSVAGSVTDGGHHQICQQKPPKHHYSQNHEHNNTIDHSTAEMSKTERIIMLEKQLFQLREKYEFSKICDIPNIDLNVAATVVDNVDGVNDRKIELFYNGPSAVTCTDEVGGTIAPLTKDHFLYNHFYKKTDELFSKKVLAESMVTTYVAECKFLQNNLELVTAELNRCEEKLSNLKQNLQISEEDLATTRVNYEEQISVLTEQVINLSDQLASLK